MAGDPKRALTIYTEQFGQVFGFAGSDRQPT